MKFKFLLCIDDTDKLGSEISCYGCAFRRWSAGSFTCALLLGTSQI